MRGICDTQPRFEFYQSNSKMPKKREKMAVDFETQKKRVDSMTAGDSKQVTIKPENAYGPLNKDAICKIKKEQLSQKTLQNQRNKKILDTHVS